MEIWLARWLKKERNYMMIHRNQPESTFTGWWFEPLWKILVNWDDYYPNMWENKKCSKPPTRSSFDEPSIFLGEPIWLKLWLKVPSGIWNMIRVPSGTNAELRVPQCLAEDMNKGCVGEASNGSIGTSSGTVPSRWISNVKLGKKMQTPRVLESVEYGHTKMNRNSLD